MSSYVVFIKLKAPERPPTAAIDKLKEAVVKVGGKLVTVSALTDEYDVSAVFELPKDEFFDTLMSELQGLGVARIQSFVLADREAPRVAEKVAIKKESIVQTITDALVTGGVSLIRRQS